MDNFQMVPQELGNSRTMIPVGDMDNVDSDVEKCHDLCVHAKYNRRGWIQLNLDRAEQDKNKMTKSKCDVEAPQMKSPTYGHKFKWFVCRDPQKRMAVDVLAKSEISSKYFPNCWTYVVSMLSYCKFCHSCCTASLLHSNSLASLHYNVVLRPTEEKMPEEWQFQLQNKPWDKQVQRRGHGSRV